MDVRCLAQGNDRSPLLRGNLPKLVNPTLLHTCRKTGGGVDYLAHRCCTAAFRGVSASQSQQLGMAVLSRRPVECAYPLRGWPVQSFAPAIHATDPAPPLRASPGRW